MRRTQLVSLLLVSLLWSGVTTAATPDPPVVDAMLTISTEGYHDLAGRVIRCPKRRPRAVGLRITVPHVTLTNAHIEGCETGVIDLGDGSVITGLTILQGTVGIYLGGTRSLVESNIVGQTTYGIVVAGDENEIRTNRIMDCGRDGLMLLGDRNLVEANRIERSAGIGLHLPVAVPRISDTEIVNLQDRPLGNTIRGNVLSQNGLDLKDLTEPCQQFRLPDGSIKVETQNTWEGNTFTTKSPDCLQ